MGLITSYFRRPRDVVAELEALDKKLLSFESARKANHDLQKRILGYLLILFFFVYPVICAVYYYQYWPEKLQHKLLTLVPFVACPFVLYFIRRLVMWFFVYRLSNCDSEIRTLLEKKKQILDTVMETETYKKAKEILDRFDPCRAKSEFPVPSGIRLGEFYNKSPLADRGKAARNGSPSATSTPLTDKTNRPPGVELRPIPQVPPKQPQFGFGAPVTSTPVMTGPKSLPRPVLPRDRSITDRVIDLLVGDGVERRYALICRRCCSHNGMALAEEFPYLSWRCAYCTLFNDARAKRPNAPPLPVAPTLPSASTSTNPPSAAPNPIANGRSSPAPLTSNPTVTATTGDFGTGEDNHFNDTAYADDTEPSESEEEET